MSVGIEGEQCNQMTATVVFNSPNILEYQWEKISGVTYLAPSSLSGIVPISPNCNGTLVFRVRTRNVCGWSTWHEFTIVLNRCQNDCVVPAPASLIGANFVLNPNPVTDLLNVSIKNGAPWFYVPIPGGLTDSNGNPVLQLIPRIRVNITIFDQSANLQFSLNNSPMPAQLNLSNLPPGTYIIIFEFNGQAESYTIIKN